MQEKRFNDSKKEIRSVLLTYQHSVTLDEFLKSYWTLLGQRLPSRSLGFPTDVAFLQSMPDVVSVSTDSHGKIHLTGLADEKSEHIQKLVSKQRKPPKRPNTKSNNVTSYHHRLPDISRNVRELKPFLPGELKAEILQLMALHQDGITFPAFTLAYRRKFKKVLPLAKGFDTLEGMIKLIPQLEIKTDGGEKKIFHWNYQSGNVSQAVYEQKKSISASLLTDKNKVFPERNHFNIHKSGIPDDIQENFQTLIQKCPEGILDIHLPPLYENITGKQFDLHELGYKSLVDLVDSLPHIFKRVLNPDDNRTWIIYPQNAFLKHSLKDVNATPLTTPEMQSYPKSRDGIPADAASPVAQYIEPTIPKDIDLNQYVPVFVSAIINPNLFWFQLQTPEATNSFEEFERDMENFYNYNADCAYKMKDSDVVIGATCVILCPKDKQWYRALIKSIPDVNLVNVLYIDYGSRENIPRNNLYYVRTKYHDYPAAAFKAQLADLKLSHNESTWTKQALERFVQLCNSAVLMAYLKHIVKDTYSVILCDTNGDTDVFLNDVLIEEGFADECFKDQNVVNYDSYQNTPEDSGFCNGFNTDSEAEFSSESNHASYQLAKKDLNSDSQSLSVNQTVSFSSESLCIDVNPISPHGKSQGTKRYIKLLELCDGHQLHFINLDSILYISSGNLAELLWNGMDSDFLIERLKYKEVDAPFLQLSKENYGELFKQCILYKIPEFEKLKSTGSSLFIYPLEWGLRILNIFGHPSIYLRLAIQNELKSFKPLDSYWKEFHYVEPHDFNEAVENFRQSISNLCLYDLKTKNEALKINKLKLLRAHSDGEEIRRIDNFQRIIGQRMEEIESLCSMFSDSL